jgi:nucleosome binding factor SPN SPT16 subunit
MGRLLAAAFHEAISVEKLDELFRSDLNQLFAGTTAAHCRNCKLQFAVFFPSSDDPENMNFLVAIEERIAADCRDGRHSAEISRPD